MNDKNFYEGLGIVVVIVAFAFAIAVNSFAPDQRAQRIAACMTKPNMEYRPAEGCVYRKD